jgi:hypothetical protein
VSLLYVQYSTAQADKTSQRVKHTAQHTAVHAMKLQALTTLVDGHCCTTG